MFRFERSPESVVQYARAEVEIRWHDALEVRLDVAPWFTMAPEFHEKDEPSKSRRLPTSRLPADLKERVQRLIDLATRAEPTGEEPEEDPR